MTLAKVGALTAGFAVFGKFLDKRELQGALPERSPNATDDGDPTEDTRVAAVSSDPAARPAFTPTLDLEGLDDVWFSFGADTGDDDAATARFARALTGSDEGRPVPRFTILGGDQVYPSASHAAYVERFCAPWQAGTSGVEPPPTVLAIPGNHDWYDGLNSFLRIFAQGGHLLGSDTPLVQGRSYWTVRLAGGWWAWGADIEFGTYVDGPQRDYFERAAAELHPGDRVILCVSKPFWYIDDADHQRGVSFLEQLVEARGAAVSAMLTGDVHHYLHLQESGVDHPQHRITCGGGGAFAHATHHLAETRDLRQRDREPATFVGRRLADDERRASSELRTLVPVGAAVPSVEESRRMVRWLWASFLPKNPRFVLVPAMLTLLYLVAAITTPQLRFADMGGAGFAPRPLGAAVGALGDAGSWRTVLLGSPGAILLDVALIGLLTAFALPGAHNERSLGWRVARGVLHALAWMVAIAAATWGTARAIGTHPHGWEASAAIVGTVTGAMVLGGVACSILMGVYLRLSWAGGKWNGNEAYSAVRDHRFVHVLHLHLFRGAEGAEVEVHPLRVDLARRGAGVGHGSVPLVPIEPAFQLGRPVATGHGPEGG